MIDVKIKPLYIRSVVPTLSDNENAGIDLYTHKFEEFENHIKVYTGVAVELPRGYFSFLASRSSTCKLGLILYNSMGIIDNGYRGELIGMFYKTRDYKPDTIKIGSRLLQLVVQKQVIIGSITESETLSETVRGTGGFGSTGN